MKVWMTQINSLNLSFSVMNSSSETAQKLFLEGTQLFEKLDLML